MATPKIIADFETQISSAISIGSTSFTILSILDDDGNTIPDGKYYLTVDSGSSNKEYFVGTLTGATKTVASVKTVNRQGTETSGAVRAHRVGANIKITDFATYKNYIDETSITGASNATTSLQGLEQLATTAQVNAGTATGSTGAALSVTPDVLLASNYNTYLPTSAEKTLLTAATTSFGGVVYAADSVGTDAYAVTLSPAVTSLTAGLLVNFKAGTANTSGATLAVNGLTAKAITKSYNSTLVTGDILANQIVSVVYDGTQFQMISPVASSLIYSNGTTSRDISTASGTQTIAHGLGIAPKKVNLFVKFGRGTTTPEIAESKGQWVSGYENCIYSNFTQGSAPTISSDTKSVYVVTNSGTWTYSGLVTVDATNITITWTKGGSPTGTAIILWEAQA